MRWWAYLFWIYAIGSLGYWIFRRTRRKTSEPSASGEPRPAGRSGGDALRADAPTTTTVAERAWPAPPPLDPTDDTYRLPTDEPASGPTPVDGPTPDLGSEPADTGGALPSPGPPETTVSTLPDLLAGITLPHELVPLTQVDVPIDLASHVVVSTTKAPAQVVREGLTEELERLGYSVEQETMMTLVATGPRGRVTVDVHPDGTAVQESGAPRFPTAPEGSVVVELRAG